MKKALKFNHDSAKDIKKSRDFWTWRLSDDKDLSAGDSIEMVDKVNVNKPASWVIFGEATIDTVTEKLFKDVNSDDIVNLTGLSSEDNFLNLIKNYYEEPITDDTPVKFIHLHATSFNERDFKKEPVSKYSYIKVYTDGGSRGNPGPSASGYVLMDDDDHIILKRGVYIGVTTNNQAEYQALNLAIEAAKKLGAEQLDIFMDSQLIVNQMLGVYKVKNVDLQPIHNAIKKYIGDFDRVNFTYVPRSLNKLADAEVNKALDNASAIR